MTMCTCGIDLPSSISDFEQWAQGDFYVMNPDENTIDLPHTGDSILFEDGIWYVVQVNGDFRCNCGGELRAWLDAREFCELSALTVMDSYPEHTLSALAYMADTELEVSDDRVIERLEEFLKSDNELLFVTSAQVLLICVEGWKLNFDLDPKFKPVFDRLRNELAFWRGLTNAALDEWKPFREHQGEVIFRMGYIYAKFMEEGFYLYRTDWHRAGDRLMFAYQDGVPIEQALQDRIEEWASQPHYKTGATLSELEVNFLHDLCYLFGSYYLSPMWSKK